MVDADGLYQRNGRSFYRVSNVVAFKHPFTTTQNTVARDKGTALHEEISRYYHDQPLTNNPDFYLFETFAKAHPHYVPLMNERTLYSEKLGIAGTIDMLFYDAENGEYVLVDWKRTRGVFSTSALRYQIQLSLYRDLLLEDAHTQIDRMVLVALHPCNKTFKTVDVPYEDQTELVTAFLASKKVAI